MPGLVKNCVETSVCSSPLKSLTVSVTVPVSSDTEYDSGSKPTVASACGQKDDINFMLSLYGVYSSKVVFYRHYCFFVTGFSEL